MNRLLPSKSLIKALLIISTLLMTKSRGEKYIPVCNNAAAFPLRTLNKRLTNPMETLVIGNGDLGAWAELLSQEFALHFGKNDAWDSRQKRLLSDFVWTQDDVIASNGEKQPANLAGAGTVCIKRVGSVRILHAGTAQSVLVSEVDIHQALMTTIYQFAQGTLTIQAFIYRLENTVLIKCTAQGTIPTFSLIMQKAPDESDTSIEVPVVSGSGKIHVVSQTIPGGYDINAFTWHLAGVFPDTPHSSAVQHLTYAVKQNIRLKDGESMVFSMGVATDRDGKGSTLDRAKALAGQGSKNEYQQKLMRHKAQWQHFWDQSGIELQDKDLEAAWYRGMYLFGIHMKPGAQCPGINANIAIEDRSMFLGCYIWNHNVQKWFFASLVCNHPEWYEVYGDLIEQHIPVWEELSRQTFGFEGVWVDWHSAPFIPPKRAMTKNGFGLGRALAHVGWNSQMLYQHYEFMQDKTWLHKRAYPYLQRAADFYANYLDKYQKEDGDIFPSIRFEDNHIHKSFRDNRNVVTDLVMFKKAFESAIQASEILGIDSATRARWQASLQRVPPIEYGWKDGEGWYAISKGGYTIWPSFPDYLHRLRHSRWGCTAWMIFPGEHLAGDEHGGLAAVVRDVMSKLDITNLPKPKNQRDPVFRMDIIGILHGEATVTPYIRLGMKEQFPKIRKIILDHRFSNGLLSTFSRGEGKYRYRGRWTGWRIHENAYFPTFGLAEMLLQSQQGVIRLFSFWPRDQYASFRCFRARGGFVVSGQWHPDSGLGALIASEAGQDCVIRWQEPDPPIIICNGNTVAYSMIPGTRDIIFPTQAGQSYQINGGAQFTSP
jgi:hypothetical protein